MTRPRLVQIVHEGRVAGVVQILVDDDVEAVHLAASVDRGLTFRVGDEEFTRTDLAEYWQ